MKLKLISCEIFYREMCAVAAKSPHRVDIEFLPKRTSQPAAGRNHQGQPYRLHHPLLISRL